MSVPQIVGEVEFVRIIKENFDRFNNPNNYRGQNIAYGYHCVNREYPRGDREMSDRMANSEKSSVANPVGHKQSRQKIRREK